MIRLIILLQFIFGLSAQCLSLVPALEREVTLTLNNERIANALTKIQEQTGLVFSYQPALINNLAPVSLKLKQKTVREALALMFPRNIIYKSKDNYIILKEKPVEKSSKTTELNGYVYDKTTDKKIANVTIYDKKTLESVTTDAYGYYSIKVPTTNTLLSVNKDNYKDTSVTLPDLKESKLTYINLNPVNDSAGRKDSSLWRSKLKDLEVYANKLVKKFRGYASIINVKDTLRRKVQVSVLPFIGTNHKLSGNVYNDISFNILGGYSKGTNGFELGTLFNVDKENVRGVQIAGLYNMAGDSLKGTQIAGLFNMTGKIAKGVQAAGLFNMNDGPHKGAQFAGLFNLNAQGSVGANVAGLFNHNAAKQKGVRIAGLINLNDSTTKGADISGLININEQSAKGAQVTGLVNITKDTLTGIAIAGLFNRCGYSNKAVQIAGLFNEAKEGNGGVRIAGLFNLSKNIKGFELAPFNFSDSAIGVPVGVFSFVKKGVHQLEVSGDEIFYTGLAFRTGVPAFYNVFSAGIQPGSGDVLWQIGYGLGTSFKIKNKLRSDITISQHHISKGNFYDSNSELLKVYWGLEYKVRKKFAIAAGPTLNLYLSDTWNLPANKTAGNAYSNIVPYTLFNSDYSEGLNVQGWVGFKVSVRFF